MIPRSKAENLVADNCSRLKEDHLPLSEAFGYAVAADIYSNEAVPAFDRAMMDGYAVIATDTINAPVHLRLVDTIQAGQCSQKVIHSGETVKIMTGAPVPGGADAVQVMEACQEANQQEVVVGRSIEKGKNIALRGSELKQGDRLMESGWVLKPSAIGALATLGINRVGVIRKPAVVLINTGTELVDLDLPAEGGKIRNSNLYTLVAFFQNHGFICKPAGVVPDLLDTIRNVIRSSAASDVIILTGGVSSGEFDLVEEAARQENFEILANRVAIKPGMPLVFGRNDNQILFGLSGNPVSSLVQAAVFVLPALRKMAGWRNYQNTLLNAVLSNSVQHRPGRESIRPARLIESGAKLICQSLPTKGSADIFAWRQAECLLLIPPDVSELAPGASVQVLVISDAVFRQD